jgi:hypothetical protein
MAPVGSFTDGSKAGFLAGFDIDYYRVSGHRR